MDAAAAIDNTMVWLLAFMPILGSVAEVIVARMLGLVGNPSMWVVTVGLNILFCTLDDRKLKAAGYDTKPLGTVWLVPAYLFKRAKYLNQSNAYAIVWCVTFVFMLFA